MMVRYLVVSVFGFQGYTLKFEIESSILLVRLFLDSSMVEHAAVNRGVVGSSPTRGECRD